MNTALMFSSAKDDWQTPPDLFAELDKEFGFGLDAAARRDNALVGPHLGPGGIFRDALSCDWREALRRADDGTRRKAVFVNPPYARGLQAKFIAKAAAERERGCTTVMLLPARTDTKAFHRHIWDAARHQPRTGVEVRFLPGRLKFVGAKHGAPFPSMICIFRGKP